MNKKGKIMRLLGQSSVTATSRDKTDTTTLFDSPKLRPRESRGIALSVAEEILCFDRSPDSQKVVIAGSGILKILKVDGLVIKEEIDLKAIIQIHAATHSTKYHIPESYTNSTIITIKWLHGPFSSIIIAASANGVITAYDLNRIGDGLEMARINAHPREIYKLAISPHKPQWLLSASRDGTVKSWNIRSPNDDPSIPYFRHWQTFKCTSEVLDVKWSPTDGLAFACCTDLGQVLKWDLRDPIKPSLRINAHSGQCYSIAWHPNGEHIASGGQDQNCNVWNLSKNGKKNQSALHTLETRAPITCVCWRPAFWSATANGMRSAQLTITYRDDRKMDALVEIWDLARPTMPFKQLPYKPRPSRKIIDSSLVEQKPELRGLEGTLEDIPPRDEGWDTAPMDIFWINRDILWTINSTIGTTDSGRSTVREGWFIQSDLAFVPSLIEQRSLSNFAFSTTGDILMILEQRKSIRRRRSCPTVPKNSPELSRNNSGPNLSSPSLTDSEEEVFGSFLGPKKKNALERSGSSRSTQANTSSPKSHGVNGNIMTLEASINITGIYQPQQVMAIGHAPSAIDGTEYRDYSSIYFTRLLKAPQVDQNPNEHIVSVTEDFAGVAEKLGHYRLAQTWRYLGMSMNLLLTRRFEFHREARLKLLELSNLTHESSGHIEMLPRPNRNREGTWKKTQLDNFFSGNFHELAGDTISEETESLSHPTTLLARSTDATISHGLREKSLRPLTEEKKPGYPEALLRKKHSATRQIAKDREALPTCSSTIHPVSQIDPSLIPTDYLHHQDDPPFTLPALDPGMILQKLIVYHTNTSKLIHVIPMLLLLLPYLPSNIFEPLHVSQIIAYVHARLNSFQLFTEAALLRNLCVPNYPEIYSFAQQNIRIGFFCTTCDKPFDPDPRISNSHWKCPRCEGGMARCPICEQREYIRDASEPESDDEKPSHGVDPEKVAFPLSTWWYCPGCAHGGHIACIQEWHAVAEPESDQNSLHSKGACPVVGCLHPCLPGSWRDQVMREKEIRVEARAERRMASRENLSSASFSGNTLSMSSFGSAIALRDMKDLLQSYAVEDVRETLDGAGKSLGENRKYISRRNSGGGRFFGRDGMRESRSH